MITTHHAYAEYLHGGDRLAQTAWQTADTAAATAATLRRDPEAIVLAVTDRHGYRVATGHAPGGLAA